MSKSTPEQGFLIDGLLALTRLLCTQYKFDYEPVGGEPYTRYVLYGDRGIDKSWVIGSSYLTPEYAVIKFSEPIREILIKKGKPVLHPEEEAAEHMSDLGYVGLGIIYICNCKLFIEEASQEIRILWGVQG